VTETLTEKIIRMFNKIIDGLDEKLDTIEDLTAYRQYATALSAVCTQAKNASDSHRLDEIERRIKELKDNL